MLEQLQVKVDEILYKELKNHCYAVHIEAIDHLVQQIKKEHPAFIPDNLVTRLSEIAAKNSEEEATLISNVRKAILKIVKEEVDLFKNNRVAA